MIKINRGLEPIELTTARSIHLNRIRNLGRTPNSKDIYGYEIVAEYLWKAQHHKCCYCEHRITKSYNDVEHYRPKTNADRSPGCSLQHGYWWLAYTWENLLFACPSCNRSHKRSLFPLDTGSTSLVAETSPPANEKPLLIDPASINPVEHIQFIHDMIKNQWRATSRNASLLGKNSIKVYGLNHQDLLELRNDHYETVLIPQINAINIALQKNDKVALKNEFLRALHMLKAKNCYVGFSYDVFSEKIINLGMITNLLQLPWPSPNQL
ncbi:hypothetical protein [Acinetobacter guillouiae]|uniref:HNH endonuclease n=1 Tax=Acinetobacter guillouiae TaxID=106649 RepID=UPI0030091A26